MGRPGGRGERVRRRESGEKSVGESSKSIGELKIRREILKIGGDRWGEGPTRQWIG